MLLVYTTSADPSRHLRLNSVLHSSEASMVRCRTTQSPETAHSAEIMRASVSNSRGYRTAAKLNAGFSEC